MAQPIDTGLPKGLYSIYRPKAGTTCLISGPNEDDDEGDVFHEATILWCDHEFVTHRRAACWPVTHKWDHVICRPLPPTICCESCQHAESPICPVREASPWSRWGNFCNKYEPKPGCPEAPWKKET